MTDGTYNERWTQNFNFSFVARTIFKFFRLFLFDTNLHTDTFIWLLTFFGNVLVKKSKTKKKEIKQKFK